MQRFLWVVASAAAVGLFAPAAVRADHPKLHEALFDIDKAADELEKSDNKFGGHKKEAIEDLRKAAKQVKEAMEHAKVWEKDFKYEKREGKDFAHLRHAEKSIDEAIIELEKSKADWGNHKEAAIKDLKKAHEQVKVCLKELK